MNRPSPVGFPTVRIAPVVLPSGEAIPVALRYSLRASRMALRVNPARHAVELVLPVGAAVQRALAFLEARRGWVTAQAARLPVPIRFVDGAEIPVLGLPHRLVALGPGSGARSPFRIGDGVIEVTGAPEHLARRTRAGLSDHARRVLAEKTTAQAGKIGRGIGRVAVGDATSRWGSCASSGNIRYSWRLILAPERVMDYVVAHEVAHLAEMNHSGRFWRVVESLQPGHAAHRAWLKQHGVELLRFG